MELRQLTYFECLYRERNVTRAAQRLNIVQPALSMQIAKLENELGRALFERTPRGVTPTPAGERAHLLFAPLLEKLQLAKDELTADDDEVRGRIRIGLVASATNEALADTIAHFARHHPDVEIYATSGFSAELVAQLRDDTLDCVVINQNFGQDDLVSQEIVDEELVVAASAAIEPPSAVPVPLHALTGMKLVLPSRRHGLRMVIDDVLRAHAAAVHPRLEIDDASVIMALLQRSDWVSILPASLVGRGLQDGSLRAYALARPGISRRMLCLSRPDTPRTKAAATFVDVLSARLEALVRDTVRLTTTTSEDP
jgi:LysR family transcriptional regulator, nitrogen assimilation regulatory protein